MCGELTYSRWRGKEIVEKSKAELIRKTHPIDVRAVWLGNVERAREPLGQVLQVGSKLHAEHAREFRREKAAGEAETSVREISTAMTTAVEANEAMRRFCGTAALASATVAAESCCKS